MEKPTLIEKDLLRLLRKYARILARRYNLKYKEIALFPEEHREKDKCHGICYPDGQIFIHVKHLCGRDDLQNLDFILDTLIHELAHLRHPNHRQKFQRFFKEMKEWFFNTHIYRGVTI